MAISPTGALGTNAITLSGGTLALLADYGPSTTYSGSSSPATLAMNNNVTVNASATITANRLAAGNPIAATPTLYTTGANQTIQLGSLTIPNAGTNLTISPSNGYAVAFSGTTTFSQPLTTLTVNTNGAVTSNVVPSAILSGAGHRHGRIRRRGRVDQGRHRQPAADQCHEQLRRQHGRHRRLAGLHQRRGLGQLEQHDHAQRRRHLCHQRHVGDKLRDRPDHLAHGDHHGRTIDFLSSTAANNIIDVANNTTLTLTSPFGTTNNGFAKNDLGTLVLSANNDEWSGAITVNEGALQVTNSGALGLATGSVSLVFGASANQGAALQLGGVTIDKPISASTGRASTRAA